MPIQTHTVYHNSIETKLAYVKKEGNAENPIIVFCGGYRSDMQGTKALFLEEYAQKNGYGYVRFDYMGHGSSGGVFEDGTISSWTKDTLSIIEEVVGDRKIILVGSSMGGWIGLICSQLLKEQIVGFVGVAAAPDFTKDMVEQFTDDMTDVLNKTGRVDLPNEYSDEPYIVTKKLIDDGGKNSLLDDKIEINCPVVLLQSKLDSSVPWQKALKIKELVTSDNVEVILLEDGNHSLSRPEDLELLASAIDGIFS